MLPSNIALASPLLTTAVCFSGCLDNQFLPRLQIPGNRKSDGEDQSVWGRLGQEGVVPGHPREVHTQHCLRTLLLLSTINSSHWHNNNRHSTAAYSVGKLYEVREIDTINIVF